MEFTTWKCRVLIIILSVILVRADSKINFIQDGNSDAMYNDVIKNISGVNNILQEQINDYAQLKKIYDSQENVMSESSDLEIDKVIKVIDKKKLQNRSDKGITFKINEDSLPAAMLYWSEQDSRESMKQLNTKVIVIETYKKSVDSEFDKENELIKNTKRKPVHVRDTSAASEVKKLIYTESLPPAKIWHDITNNKSIKLEPHDKTQLLADESEEKFRSKPGKTALLIIGDNLNKLLSNILESKLTLSSKSAECDLEDEEDTLTKELIKLSMLRDNEYTEICLKMVVRKCYKACKKVRQSICRLYRCKSDFKKHFNEYSKLGCLNEFNAHAQEGQDQIKFKNHGVGKNNENDDKKSISIKKKTDGSFKDLTRTDYLRMACLPYVKKQNEIKNHGYKKNRDSNFFLKEINKDNKKHILRDRYERKYNRESSNKCRAACTYAYQSSCQKLNCISPKKRAFKKECKRQCNFLYRVSYSSSSSSHSSSSASGGGSSHSGISSSSTS